jgi:hypothetical protein
MTLSIALPTHSEPYQGGKEDEKRGSTHDSFRDRLRQANGSKKIVADKRSPAKDKRPQQKCYVEP